MIITAVAGVVHLWWQKIKDDHAKTKEIALLQHTVEMYGETIQELKDLHFVVGEMKVAMEGQRVILERLDRQAERPDYRKHD